EFAINLDNLKGNVNVINNSKIVINGTEIKTILNQDKQVMIHLRSLAENLGYKVDWNGGDQSILLTKDQATAKIKIGENIYIANHKIPYILEAAAVIIDDSTYVPLSFVEKVLLYQID
ncbi:MAG TPA: copper amine oxidase N-terminal domain-containing protein, partial [Syntrophomonadaceae bacterium]|nr:copper amine oxidase N-terminal domain-containing protein [Syntrophomonadaceae bacterium]